MAAATPSPSSSTSTRGPQPPFVGRQRGRILDLVFLAVFVVAFWTTINIDVFSPAAVDNDVVILQQQSGTTTEQAGEEGKEKEQLGRSHVDYSRRTTIPLNELVDTEPETLCPRGLLMVRDIRTIDPNITKSLNPRKIPRIIHMTSKSRCVTPTIYNFIETWKQSPDHLFYFHNDAAMKRLIFQQYWPEFPELSIALECSNTIVEWVDLWRALVLWEYGGIYTDLDNIPNQFNPTHSIAPSDEAYFEVERGQWLSQYFFAAEPRHPLMYFLVTKVWARLFALPNIDTQYAPYITGPGALKDALKQFMQTHQLQFEPNKTLQEVFERVRKGHYVGLNNRTMTVVRMSSAVIRNVIGTKSKQYKAMNMTGYHQSQNPNDNKKAFKNYSCWNHLYMERYGKNRKTTVPDETANTTIPSR